MMRKQIQLALRSRSLYALQSRRFDLSSMLAEPDALLFTPGPLSTSRTVKEAMLHDWGSRDSKMIGLIDSVRSRILEVADVSEEDYTSVLLQGSGTFGVESMITSCIPPDGKLLVLINGAYGSRAKQIAATANIEVTSLEYAEDEVPSLEDLDMKLREDPAITHVLTIHSETTSGIVNPVGEIGKVVNSHGKRFMVDAMSSFGAVPVDFADADVDYLVSSSNKCLEGVPGFSFCIAKKEAINQTKGWARSVSLDMYSQMAGLDKNGQFRFTPPCHTIIAFHQALDEHREEGGVLARLLRYQMSQRICVERMNELGFQTYLEARHAGPIITSFRYPNCPNWDFETFYKKLAERNYVIYPGKVSNADCFRIGHIGHVFPADTEALMDHVSNIVEEMRLFKAG